jgi:urease accessory protein
MNALASTRGGLAELPLLLWLSPAFPVGSFAYSHGLEWAVEAEDIVDAPTLCGWLTDLIAFGALRVDAIVFAFAFRAAGACAEADLMQASEFAIALAGSAERRLETCSQGSAFLAAVRAAWDCPALAFLSFAFGRPVAYPVVVATAAAGHGFALLPSLEAFIASGVANLVSAGVRLGPIGQTDGQRILAGLLPVIRAAAFNASTAGLDDIGACVLRSDIAAMKHETQYSRLFRT